jgi:hypothetical protein
MVRLLLDGELYPHRLKVRHYAGYPNVDGPVCLIVPGRYYAQHTDQINESIKRFVSVLMVVTSDEEALFPVDAVVHDRLKLWCQTPRKGREYPVGTRFIGVGFPPHFNNLPQDPPDKAMGLFMSAQNTHDRRAQAFEALSPLGCSGSVYETGGFTQGISPADYVEFMVGAKAAPCPSGAVSPDSFRLFEALEAHCVPVADTVSPVDGVTRYWHRLFPDCPFPMIENYSDLAGYVEDALKGWPANANRITAYYMGYKRGLARGLREDLEALGAL